MRALELAEAGATLAGDDLWGAETRHPTLVFGLDVPDDVLEQRIRARAASMLERGVAAEARAALARPLSRSAGKVMGLVDFASLPPDEAREALVANNRRLASMLARLPHPYGESAARAFISSTREQGRSGAVYAVTDYSAGNSSQMWGPVIARQISISNSTLNDFPPIMKLMTGMPSSYTTITTYITWYTF